MKPSQTALESIKNTPALRTDGEINSVLGNVLLALLRKEISATDATAAVAITDGMCNVMNTTIKAMRLKIDLQKSTGEKVKLVELGQQVFTGEHQ